MALCIHFIMHLSLLLKSAVCQVPQILVQCVATNVRFVFVTFKNGAGNGFLQFADVLGI